jgi:hypothetical protein
MAEFGARSQPLFMLGVDACEGVARVHARLARSYCGQLATITKPGLETVKTAPGALVQDSPTRPSQEIVSNVCWSRKSSAFCTAVIGRQTPASTAHQQLTSAKQRTAGVPPADVVHAPRVSSGISRRRSMGPPAIPDTSSVTRRNFF